MFTLEQIRNESHFYQDGNRRKLRRPTREEAEAMTDEQLYLWITASTYCFRPCAAVEQLNANTECHRRNGRQATLDLFFPKPHPASINDMF